MVSYSQHLHKLFPAIFPPLDLPNTLGEVLARAGLRQLRIAETEKYAHVTFFFNGGREEVFAGEDRILVPSPKVATYDLKPDMSALEVTDRLVGAIESGDYDFLLVNYANGDMVGHSGDLSAAVAAVECLDRCLGRLEPAVRSAGGLLLITADHGNCEEMADRESGQANTAHTINPVPAILVGQAVEGMALHNGRLCDIAPSLLDLLGLAQPPEMSGLSLLDRSAEKELRAERVVAE
jgi:2,3-bisphosphoglycerate-independent phosphoglycerate mutase